MNLKSLLVISLVTGAINAHAQTVVDFSRGIAQTRAEISVARDATTLAHMLAKYQQAANSNCNVKYYLKTISAQAYSVVPFVKGFVWGVNVANQRTIRAQYGFSGSRIDSGIYVAGAEAQAYLSNVEKSFVGEHGICTLINEQIRMVQEAISAGSFPVTPVIDLSNGQTVPMVIVPPAHGGMKH